MVRVVLFVCLVSLCLPIHGTAQEPPAAQGERSPLSDLVAAINKASGGVQQISDTHWRIERLAELPIPPNIRIFADVIDLYLESSQLVATGNVAFVNPEGRVHAERIEYNFNDGTASFQGASGIVRLPDADPAQFGGLDPDVYFWGERIEKVGPKKYLITSGGFSTCVQPTARWEFTAETITLNLDDYALARNTVLRVKGVPLLYLPAIYYPLQEGQRSTGFLMPTYGTSTLRGGSLSNAFFWAIGRSQDATFFHDWFTRSGQGLGSEYRYIANAQSSGTVRFYRFNQNETEFQEDGATELLPAKTTYQLDAAINQDLGPLKGQGSIEYFTDVETQQLYHQNAYQRSQSRRRVAAGVSGTFGPATVASYFERSELFSDTRNSQVYGSLPRATAIITPSRLFGLPVYAGLTSEYAFIPSQRRLDGKVTSDSSLGRLNLAPSLRVPLSRLTYLSVNTAAAYSQNYVWPRVDQQAPPVQRGLTRQDFSLQTDIVGPVLAKIWDTPESTFSERMKHVIEPTFGITYVTQINAALPTVSQLSTNTASTRLTYGLTNRLFARAPSVGSTPGGTHEFLTVGVQQTYYTDERASLTDTTYVSARGRPRPVDLSPIAIITRFSPRTGFDANSRIEYDVTGNGFQIFTAGGTFTSLATGSAAGSGSSVNVSFSRQRFTPAGPVSSYLSTSTTSRFRQGRTSAFYALNWDLAAGYIYSQSVGASYLAQCCGVQADFQVVNYPPALRAPVPADRRLNFSVVLAGLGTFSNFFGLLGGQP